MRAFLFFLLIATLSATVGLSQAATREANEVGAAPPAVPRTLFEMQRQLMASRAEVKLAAEKVLATEEEGVAKVDAAEAAAEDVLLTRIAAVEPSLKSATENKRQENKRLRAQSASKRRERLAPPAQVEALSQKSSPNDSADAFTKVRARLLATDGAVRRANALRKVAEIEAFVAAETAQIAFEEGTLDIGSKENPQLADAIRSQRAQIEVRRRMLTLQLKSAAQHVGP